MPNKKRTALFVRVGINVNIPYHARWLLPLCDYRILS
jgi:hypothetical protein